MIAARLHAPFATISRYRCWRGRQAPRHLVLVAGGVTAIILLTLFALFFTGLNGYGENSGGFNVGLEATGLVMIYAAIGGLVLATTIGRPRLVGWQLLLLLGIALTVALADRSLALRQLRNEKYALQYPQTPVGHRSFWEATVLTALALLAPLLLMWRARLRAFVYLLALNGLGYVLAAVAFEIAWG